MDDSPPTPEQLQTWRALRKIVGHVGSHVARDLLAAVQLGVSEFIVLSFLEAAGRGGMRQVALAERMELHKSQLSHLLNKMQQRGLIERQPVGKKGVMVTMTEHGRGLRRQGQPVYNRAIRQNFIQKLSPEQLEAILEMAEQLGVKTSLTQDLDRTAGLDEESYT